LAGRPRQGRECPPALSRRELRALNAMSLAPRLDLRQSQSLVMTPQLQQAIKLLALSNLEIETFIAEELDKNPLLDAQPGDDGEAREPEPMPEFEERDGPADAAELLNGGAEAA